ncbi:MAG: PD-(D/E)XK nuclease family protein [Phycisphaerae bacterium]
MTAPVELIVGPARSGKAARLLAAYCDALAEAGPGKALMLVPTALRRLEAERRLLEASEAGVLIRPQVLTLPTLAERLLLAAGRTVRRIHELARRRVIRDALDDLDDEAADPLGEVRSARGLVGAIDALLRELKAARVEPDAFGQALTGPLRTDRNRLLVLLYTAYQRRLKELDLYDDQGQFWYAADLLRQGEAGPFEDLALLAVDGFQHVDPAQLDVIEALSERAARTLITLTWEPGRPQLFSVTTRTRERLRERFGDRLTETSCDEPSGLPEGLERLRTRLFLPPDEAETKPAADGTVAVIQAAGRTREVEEVARRAVDLVRSGAGRPGAVGIIARSLQVYGPLVRQVFPAYGLPFRVEAGVRPADVPAVAAAMAHVRLQAEGYSFRALARLLQSAYFRAEAFGGTAETARDAVRLARDAAVWKGPEAYFRGFDHLRGRLARDAETTDETGDPVLPPAERAARAKEIDRAETLLRTLFEATALPASAPRRVLAARLREIVRAAGLWDTAADHDDPGRRARDLQALAALDDALDEVSVLDASEPREVTAAEFLEDVQHGLSTETLASPEPADAPVVVLDAAHCRALSFEHVFVLGLAEKAFPRRERRHPFFTDAERADLRPGGVDLADTAHAAQEEMLLFYLAATRAERSLTLSYPSLDDSGRPQLASHYVDEVRALFAPTGDGSSGVPTDEVGVRDVDLPLARARSRRELLAGTMFALWGPGASPDLDRDLAVLDGLAPHGPDVETALAGLAAEWEREHGEAFGPFDGCLAAPAILEALCERFPGASAMSAHRLERFGGCPFAFLAADLLGLEPREEPSPDLAPMDLGLIYHGLLERFFRAARSHKTLDGRVTEETLEAALALLEETAETYFGRLEAGGRVRSPALWSVQRRHILRDVAGLLAWHAANLADWHAAETEVAFGTGEDASPPITVPTAHGPLRLRGRIDRLDRGPDGGGYQVVDYKSGTSAPGKRDMQRGTSFQLPVYLEAAEARFGPAPADALARAFFLPIRSPAFKSVLSTKATKTYPRGTAAPARERAAAYIARFIEAMRKGCFPVYPRDGCSNHCAFQTICRFAEWRIERKWEAHPIPELDVLPEDDETADAGEEEGDA